MKRLKTAIIIVALFGLISCSEKKEDKGKELPQVEESYQIPVEHIDPTPDQAERRQHSEEICKSYGIPIYTNPNALFVNPEDSVEIRLKDEVVDRVYALLYQGLKSEGLEQELLDQIFHEYKLGEVFTPNEKKYVFNTSPTEQQIIDANWRYESMHVLLWSLGYIEELSYPSDVCNVAEDVKIIYDLGPIKFREQANLRSKEEILDEADLILRFDWACVNARVNGEDAPGNLNSSVVYERHYSLNWLINFYDLDWDDVTTDT